MADNATPATPVAVNWDRWIAIAVWVMTALLAYKAGQPIPQPPPVDPKPAVIVLTTAPQASVTTHP